MQFELVKVSNIEKTHFVIITAFGATPILRFCEKMFQDFLEFLIDGTLAILYPTIQGDKLLFEEVGRGGLQHS